MGRGGARWLMVVAVLGCQGQEPATTLDVRSPQPGTVWQNRVSCSGELNIIYTCELRFPARARDGNAPGVIDVWLGAAPPLGGALVQLHLTVAGGGLVDASAEVVVGCDDLPCDTPPRILDGWIAADAVSTDPAGRNAGRFSLTLADGEVNGTYDTAGLVASHWWVVDSLDVADTPESAEDVAVLRDPFDVPANRLGRFLASIPSHQQAADEGVITGSARQLVGLPEALDLGQTARWVPAYVIPGVDTDRPADPADDLLGSEAFTAVRAAEDVYPIGDMFSSRYAGQWGKLRIRLPLTRNGTVVDLPVENAVVGARELSEATVGGGALGGTLSPQDIADVLVPALHDSFTASVAADCTGLVCTPGSAGEHILANYDGNGDGDISFKEVADNPSIRQALAPDLDLYDSDGTYDPNGDGVLDSLSLGFHFTAVSARLVPE